MRHLHAAINSVGQLALVDAVIQKHTHAHTHACTHQFSALLERLSVENCKYPHLLYSLQAAVDARLRTCLLVLLANAMSHPVLARAALTQADAVNTMVALILVLPGPSSQVGPWHKPHM